MPHLVYKGASLAIVAVVLGTVELLAELGLVVLGNGLPLSELLFPVGKSALKKELSLFG